MVVVCLQETRKKAFRLVRRYFNQSPAVLLTVCAQPEYSQSQPTDVGGATRVGQWISSCDRCDLKSLVEDTTTSCHTYGIFLNGMLIARGTAKLRR